MVLGLPESVRGGTEAAQTHRAVSAVLRGHLSDLGRTEVSSLFEPGESSG
jgi:hypothetical protein